MVSETTALENLKYAHACDVALDLSSQDVHELWTEIENALNKLILDSVSANMAMSAEFLKLESRTAELIDAENRLLDSLSTYLEEDKTDEVVSWNAIVAELEAFKKIVNDCGFDVVTDAAILEYPERKILTGHGAIYVPVEGA